jgi:hypothetical protein
VNSKDGILGIILDGFRVAWPAPESDLLAHSFVGARKDDDFGVLKSWDSQKPVLGESLGAMIFQTYWGRL